MYDNREACMPSTVRLGRNLTISEKLYQQRKDLTERLDLVNKAIESIEKNPGVLETIDAISKVGY